MRAAYCGCSQVHSYFHSLRRVKTGCGLVRVEWNEITCVHNCCLVLVGAAARPADVYLDVALQHAQRGQHGNCITQALRAQDQQFARQGQGLP
jgi:hypothetical protein